MTCKQCNFTFARQKRLEYHLLSHENKRQFICPQDGCDKTFNNKYRLKEYEVIHLKNKLFHCNYCLHKTDRRDYLIDHIKAKHTRQDLVKCNWPRYGKEFTKINLKKHIKRIHENTNKFKCTFDSL